LHEVSDIILSILALMLFNVSFLTNDDNEPLIASTLNYSADKVDSSDISICQLIPDKKLETIALVYADVV